MDTEPTTPPSTALAADGRLRRAVIGAAGLAVLAGGLLHLNTWNSDYREIPDGVVPGLWVVKVGFPVNTLASVLLAAGLIAVAFGALSRIRLVVLGAALALQVGSIAALIVSRGPGIFGWSEKGWEGDAVQILIVEVVAAALLVAAFVLDRRASDQKS